jgi:hypothetical protein
MSDPHSCPPAGSSSYGDSKPSNEQGGM